MRARPQPLPFPFPVGRSLLLALSLLALGLSTGSAQANKPRRIALAAFGYNLTELGLRIGYEGAYFVRGIHELYATANVGGHAGPSVGYSLFTQFEAGYRINSESGIYLDVRLGLGYSNWFRPESYVDNGVSGPLAVPQSSTNLLTPQAVGGIGMDLGRRISSGLSIFALAGAMGRYDFAGSFGGAPVMLLGLLYQFGRGQPVRPTMPVPSVPPAVAPSLPEDGQPASDPLAPQPGPAEPAPPTAPGPEPSVPLSPLPADVPSLPPPPTVPYTPPVAG